MPNKSKNINIQKKISIPIITIITVFLFICAFITVHYIRDLTRKKVEINALGLIQQKADKIELFFTEKIGVLNTFLTNPFFLEWYSQYEVYRKPLENDQNYHKIIGYINQIVRDDTTIKSIFFAMNNTQEYFDHEGRYELEGYKVKERPWWNNALRENKLYCDLEGIDYKDSTFTATLQLPIYEKKGRLLGVAGMDISFHTISNLLRDINYEGYGKAFLIDDDNRIIYFPGIDREEKLFLSNLSSIDSLSADNSNFYQLSQSIMANKTGLTNVKWEGNANIVLYTPVMKSKSVFNWTLGLMVPEKIIQYPINKITKISVIAIFIAVLILSVITFFLTSFITDPLNRLAQRLDEIANERSDLTKELPVESHDVIGHTARNFNTFISHIRELLTVVIHNTTDVAERTAEIHKNSAAISDEASQMSDQAKKVANISPQMLATINEINQKAGNVADFSKESNDLVVKGERLMEEKIKQMENISTVIKTTFKEMKSLNKRSKLLKETVLNINEINTQINTLSLNASLEAIHAGKAGKGFSVIVKEIKMLSQYTKEINEETSVIIDSVSRDIKTLHNYMIDLNKKITEEIESFKVIVKTFNSIHKEVGNTDQAADEMKNEVYKQIDLIRSIDSSIQQMSQATGHIAEGISSSFEEISGVDSRVKKLQESTGEFKV